MLLAEIIYEVKEESYPSTREIEMLEVWQFTYRSTEYALSDYLGSEIPSRKSNKQDYIT